MTTPLLSIIGILLATASGSMLVYHGGDALESGVSRAQTASAVLMVSQVAQAVQLHDLQEGAQYRGPDLDGLVAGRYLRGLPSNPTGGEPPRVTETDGRRVVSMPILGTNGAGCDKVSALLEKAPRGAAGCRDDSGRAEVYAVI